MAGYFFAFLLSEVLFDNPSDHSGYEKLQLYQLQVNPLLINLAALPKWHRRVKTPGHDPPQNSSWGPRVLAGLLHGSRVRAVGRRPVATGECVPWTRASGRVPCTASCCLDRAF